MPTTEAGIILGTAAYMSPEQARGLPVDKRADVWAFGVVLYELLTGKQMFTGESTTDILSAVVRADRDWSALPAATPSSIRRLLTRCVERDLKKRQPDVSFAVGDNFALAASADGESALFDLPSGNTYRIVSAPLNGSNTLQTILTVTKPIGILDVGRDGSLYLDQTDTSIETLRVSTDGGTPERLGTIASYNEFAPQVLALWRGGSS